MTQELPVFQTDHTSLKADTEKHVPVVNSDVLLTGCTEILIRHGSEVYRLRVTRAGKLILTK